MDERDIAFAEILYHKARHQAGGMCSRSVAYINSARNGVYRKSHVRPAFIYEAFGITDQEWDALWALIYG